MRTIKFRAWDGNRMIDSPYFFETNTGDGSKMPYRCYEDWRELEDGRDSPCEIMQLTGLRDKKGKEIFEGDVIRYLNGEVTSTPNGMEGDQFETDGVIFWDDEWAQWDVTNRIDVTREEVFTEISDCEVIGNIYQNPELLNPNQP